MPAALAAFWLLAAGAHAADRQPPRIELENRGDESTRHASLRGQAGPQGKTAEELPEPQSLSDPNPVVRGLLGVKVVTVTKAVRTTLGETVRRGAVIRRIQPGSPADRYGLPLGGVVVALDRQRVEAAGDLETLLARTRAGQAVQVTYYHDGQRYRKLIRLVPDIAPLDGEPARWPDSRSPHVLRPLPFDDVSDTPAGRRDHDHIDALTEQVRELQFQVDQLERFLLELDRSRHSPRHFRR